MISPGWASAFASPPAAIALAMAAAGAGGGDVAPSKNTPLRREMPFLERRASRLRSFTSFQKALDLPGSPQPVPKDKAAAKATALAAARDLERNAKIGSGKGLSAVVMATSAQRRSLGDRERVKRWNNFEAMETAWLECSQLADAAMASEKDFSMLVLKYIQALAAMFDKARNMRQEEIDRRALVAAADGFRTKVGARAWRRLICCLIEHEALFGPLGCQLDHPERVFWKLDFVENSLRMQRLLKRNYSGTSHKGAAANYEDIQPMGRLNIEENKDFGKEAESSLGNSLPANASLLLPEESLLEEGHEDEGTRSDFEITEDRKDDLEHDFVSSEDISEPSGESTLDSVKSSNIKEIANNAIALAGSTVVGADERMLLEIPAMMVQPFEVNERKISGIYRLSFIGGFLFQHPHPQIVSEAMQHSVWKSSDLTQSEYVTTNWQEPPSEGRINTAFSKEAEFSSSKAALKLSELVKASIKVQRCAGRVVQTELQVQIDQKDVVPGDIIIFSSGDLFPGDVRLLSSQAVVVSQSSLTGESGIVEKTTDIIEEPNTPLLELRNICFMGTSVVSGSSTGVVVSTGEKTYISTILSALGRQSPPDAFEKGVKHVSYMLIFFMLVIIPIIVTVDYLTTHDWGRSVLFGITVAVGLTPQMLPLIVNTNLAKGAFAMARDKCIVKRLVAIQNMGSIDVLCTDKTGTLTMDRVVMVHHLDSWGMSSDKILYFTFLNSYFQTGFKNPLDDAILAYVYTGGYKFEPTKWIRINKLPFDFSRRRMSVILEEINHNHVHRNKHPLLVERIMVTKGAYEEVLKVCSFFQKDIHDDSLEPLSSQDYQRLFNMGEELSNDGLRVIGVAKRKLKPVCSDYVKILKKFFVCQNNAQDSKVSEGASSNAITNSSNDGSHGHVCNSGPLVVITTPLKRWKPSKCVPLAPIHVQATISPQTKAKVGQPRKIRIKGETSH